MSPIQATVMKMDSTVAKTRPEITTEPQITNVGPKEDRYVLRNNGKICLERKEYFKSELANPLVFQ